ncbi:hypothetical protein ACPPVU_12725 [Mucilaginibacter sp. McL0603]|uniref:hypothetical protein n=1 Tax=Mucilaginibacter sp. McL0603 TaxID=3415670 RepID=UPI003CED7F53
MKPYLFACLILTSLVDLCLFSSCDAIIEPSISKKTVQLQAPTDQYQSTSYTVNFWWNEVGNALSYHLQVVTPNFAAPGSLVLDTMVKKNTFSFNLTPGSYQWRVMAENGSSQTVFTNPRNFTVAATSIKQQSVQLIAPANTLLTNQNNIIFQWGSLYGATKYQLEIDTNNFANETLAVYNQTIPAQQINFSFPKDQNYQWRVRAENDTAQAQWSAINTVVYDHTPPAAVTLSSPAAGSTVPLPVTLQWNPVNTAAKYKLYVYQGDGSTIYDQSFPMLLNTTSYSFKLGNSGDKIYWMVTAIDAAGNESQAGIQRSFILQ